MLRSVPYASALCTRILGNLQNKTKTVPLQMQKKKKTAVLAQSFPAAGSDKFYTLLPTISKDLEPDS